MRRAASVLLALALLPGVSSTASAQEFTVGVQVFTYPETVIPSGGPVDYFIGVSLAPDTPTTVTSVESNLYGDLADPSNPLILTTTCAVPATHNPGEYVGAYEWGCEFTASVGGDPGVVVDTVVVTVEAEDGTGSTGMSESRVTISDTIGAIQGVLTDAVTGLPIVGENVDAISVEAHGSNRSDSDGFYSIQGLLPGEYRLESGNTMIWPETDYARTWYGGGGRYETATLITVAPGTATVVDWSLSLGGVVEGTVSDEASGLALEDVFVSLIEIYPNGSLWDFGYGPQTDIDGFYRHRGIHAGEFIVCFHRDGYEQECWNDHAVPSDWNSRTGDIISVGLATTYSGVDIELKALTQAAPEPLVSADELPWTGATRPELAPLAVTLLALGLAALATGWFRERTEKRRG